MSETGGDLLPAKPTLESVAAHCAQTYRNWSSRPEENRASIVRRELREQLAMWGETEKRTRDLRKKLRAQYLYVHQGASVAEIADDTGLTKGQVSRLVENNATWELERMAVEEKARLVAVSGDVEAARKAGVEEVVEEIRSRSGELALAALELGAKKAAEEDAQGLSYTASAAKAFNGMFREAHGLDAEGNGVLGKRGLTLNVLVGNFARAVEVSAVPVVEEAEATKEWGFD